MSLSMLFLLAGCTLLILAFGKPSLNNLILNPLIQCYWKKAKFALIFVLLRQYKKDFYFFRAS